MADFAYDTLKITKNHDLVGQRDLRKGVADNFSKRVVAKGGTSSSFGLRHQDHSDFKPFLQRAKDGGAGGIYAGATSGHQGCQPRAQSKGIIDVPYMAPMASATPVHQGRR